MKPLPEKFDGRADQRGWKFTQLNRVGNIALFEKEKNGSKTWEVFKVRQNPERIMGGTVIPAAESVPPSTAWGQEGWTCMTLKDAEMKFTKLSGMA